ncbi:alpha/beta hydrolase [Paenibacillus sedimenti]|uniref:alpha/beta hydrolase n=1 Tax=Paenibacillus sedimenti TaxID=2770274 RepID=UPI001CB73696|nr:alpha/beta fold hydrolase [Paenibacillus sedimenti]
MKSTSNRKTYNESVVYWRQYQPFMPEDMRLKPGNLPLEDWWKWRDFHIHLDRMPVEQAPVKVILIHGAGGNGRLLAPFGLLLQREGYDVVAPDLPPYGLSYHECGQTADYPMWIEMLSDLIQAEIDRDGKPIIVIGTSIGGMIAYHAAAHSQQAIGVIATTFADTSRQEVRDQIAPNRMISRLGKLLLDRFPFALDPIRIPITSVSRMHLITNNPELTKLIKHDPHAAGINIPLRLLRTFLNAKPAHTA